MGGSDRNRPQAQIPISAQIQEVTRYATAFAAARWRATNVFRKRLLIALSGHFSSLCLGP